MQNLRDVNVRKLFSKLFGKGRNKGLDLVAFQKQMQKRVVLDMQLPKSQFLFCGSL